MNVVGQWRDRARALRGEMFRCEGCGRLAAVRRLACTACGAAMQTAPRASMPRSLRAIGQSHAHRVVESMDQVTALHPVMLAEARSGQLFALPLCETDAQLREELVGETLELVLRRKGDRLGPADPIAYGRKLAAGSETRLRLKRNSKKEG